MSRAEDVELENNCRNCIHMEAEEYDPAPSSVPGSSTMVDARCKEGHDEYFGVDKECPHFQQIKVFKCSEHNTTYVDQCSKCIQEAERAMERAYGAR